MRLKNKPWAQPYLATHRDVALDLGAIDAFLKTNDRPLNLEIGCGKGQFLADIARKNPHETFLGIERAVTPCAIAARRIVKEEIGNAYLLKADAADLYDVFSERSIRTIYLNFPDPWPKKRHHKRRLTAPAFLAFYRRILIDEGIVALKTDNEELYQFSQQNFAKNGYNIVRSDTDYDGMDESDAQSEYERAFRSDGLPIYRIVARKG